MMGAVSMMEYLEIDAPAKTNDNAQLYLLAAGRFTAIQLR